ncbi:MAG: DUF6364 family protein [Geminicoccales bacterium]
MPNLTVTIDAELLRAAKVHAARTGTSISRIVRQHLAEVTGLQPRPEDDDVLARYARDQIGRHEAMRALGVDYGTLLELMAERGLAVPRVPDQEAEAMARTFARVWRNASEA